MFLGAGKRLFPFPFLPTRFLYVVRRLRIRIRQRMRAQVNVLGDAGQFQPVNLVHRISGFMPVQIVSGEPPTYRNSFPGETGLVASMKNVLRVIQEVKAHERIHLSHYVIEFS